MTELTRRERRKICKEYYRKCRKGKIEKFKKMLLDKIRSENQTT